MPKTVPALPDESFQRVLCVVAHPDDMEYGVSAAVAKWTAQGIEVGYLVLTHGEAGMPNPPEETARLRVAEQRAACDVVGVKHLTVLDHPDGVLVYNLDLRRDICREIRLFKPDVVLSGSGYEVDTPMGFNHADHRVVALATLDAVRDAGNRWVFPEQIGELEAHNARWFITPDFPGDEKSYGVDVTGEPLRRGVASLEAHAAYLAALPDHPAPADIIPMFTGINGKAMGVDHAVLFRAVDFQAPPEFPSADDAG